MRKLLLVPALLCAVLFSGCSGNVSVRDAITAATATITNPVDTVEIYRVKNAYAAALTAADNYRTYCWSKPYSALMADPVAKPVCQSRRQVVRSMQDAQRKAAAAIAAAEKFMRDFPTLSAANAIGVASSAVAAFRSVSGA